MLPALPITQTQQGCDKHQNCCCKRNILPNCNCIDCVVWKNCKYQCKCRTPSCFQTQEPHGRNKITNAECHDTHLCKGIKAHGKYHITRYGKSDRIKDLHQKRMYPRMMIAIGNHAQYLLKLIYAVRCHNSGKLIQEIGQPSQQTDHKCRRQWMYSEWIPAFDRLSFAEELFHLLLLHNPKEQKFQQCIKQGPETNCGCRKDSAPKHPVG